MAKKLEETEAAPAEAPTAAQPETAAPIPNRKRLGVGSIAGITIGAVIAAGLLFGGGVLVGTTLNGAGGPTGGPGYGQFDDDGGFPPGPGGGERPDAPDGDADDSSQP